MAKFISALDNTDQAPSASAAELVPLSDVEIDAVSGGLFNSNGIVAGNFNQATGLVAANALNVGVGIGSVL